MVQFNSMPDLKLSPLIAGTMKWGAWGSHFSTREYQDMINACLEAGVTSFDHADIYGHYTTESEFGAALAGMPGIRGGIQLISKCGILLPSANRPAYRIKSYDSSRQHILQSVEQSLKNLHTDYLDLLLLHRPDTLMQADEIAEAFRSLQESGKVLHFGVSNFSTTQAALLHSRFPIRANQVEASVLHLEPFLDGTLDQCQLLNLKTMAWSPLGGGSLFAETEDERIRRVLAMAEILGREYAASPEQILLSWLLKHPAGIHPVLGTTRQERIGSASKAAGIQLSREEWFMLWRASTGTEVP